MSNNVYMYQAALYCEDCGEAIRKKLEEQGEAPEDPDDETSYDSSDFPAGPYPDGGGEADGPQHCDCGAECLDAVTLPCGDKIGAWLENPLTEDGVRDVISVIQNDLVSDDAHARQVGRLWRQWYADEIGYSDAETLVKYGGRGHSEVLSLLATIAREQYDGLVNFCMLDLDSIYAVGWSGSGARTRSPSRGKKGIRTIWKVSAKEDGDFDHLMYVEIPEDMWESAEEAIAAANDSYDWQLSPLP
jgi:hypothetical protein